MQSFFFLCQNLDSFSEASNYSLFVIIMFLFLQDIELSIG